MRTILGRKIELYHVTMKEKDMIRSAKIRYRLLRKGLKKVCGRHEAGARRGWIYARGRCMICGRVLKMSFCS